MEDSENGEGALSLAELSDKNKVIIITVFLSLPGMTSEGCINGLLRGLWYGYIRTIPTYLKAGLAHPFEDCACKNGCEYEKKVVWFGLAAHGSHVFA